MRVIEPRAHHVRPSTLKKKRQLRRRVLLTLFIFVLVGAGLWWGVARQSQKTGQEPQGTDVTAATSVQDLEKVASAQDVTFKFFTGDQFQRLYESLNFPNTESIVTPPSITGDQAADARIQTIALSRGYKLRSVPVLPIIKTNAPRLTDDDLLQPKAFSAWQVLKDMASKDGIPLALNSGYRSIESQRALFLSRLRANGGNTAAIAAGQADNAVVQTLLMTAPPGYSRHHTGYTIDLLCEGTGGVPFETTACFRWISSDNYDIAKRAGWVPSYPEDTPAQGPEPESWEYVWVGLNQVTQ